jgi:hypothetical protein
MITTRYRSLLSVCFRLAGPRQTRAAPLDRAVSRRRVRRCSTAWCTLMHDLKLGGDLLQAAVPARRRRCRRPAGSACHRPCWRGARSQRCHLDRTRMTSPQGHAASWLAPTLRSPTRRPGFPPTRPRLCAAGSLALPWCARRSAPARAGRRRPAPAVRTCLGPWPRAAPMTARRWLTERASRSSLTTIRASPGRDLAQQARSLHTVSQPAARSSSSCG